MASTKPRQSAPPSEAEVILPEHLPALQPRRPPTLAPAPDANATEWPTNFDLTTAEGKAGLINASNPADWIPSDRRDFRMAVTHYVVMPDEVVDKETGETRPCSAVVLVSRDGKTAMFRNEWSPRKIHAMLKLYPPERWAQGIEIECQSKPSRQQGRMYGTFRVVME